MIQPYFYVTRVHSSGMNVLREAALARQLGHLKSLGHKAEEEVNKEKHLESQIMGLWQCWERITLWSHP